MSFGLKVTNLHLMSAVSTTVVVPLFTDPDGAVRVRGTRVLLDVIITAFQSGATAEEISQQFPSVSLADVYLIIAHYLSHTAEVEAYLAGRQTEAAELQREIEKRFDPAGVRGRLLARRNGGRASQ